MAFFKSTKSAVAEPLQESETALQNAFQRRETTLQGAFQDIGLDVAKKKKKRCWNVKSAQPATNNRHGAAKIAGTCIAAISATAAPFATSAAAWLAIIWLLCLAVLILSDALHFFDRFLSFQARAIVSAWLIIIDIVLLADVKGMESPALLKLAGITGAGGLILILTLNSKWLAAEQWLMTEAGQTALLTDTDNAAVRAWQSYGRRETRSLLYTLGTETTDNALDIVHRPIWLAGYLSASERIGRYKEKLRKLEARAAQSANLQVEAKEAKQDADRYYNELREVKTELAFTEKEFTALQKDYNKLAARQEELIRANEELMQALEEAGPAAAKEHREHAQESNLQRILDLIEQGASQAAAAKALGLSATKVSRMLKEAREAGQIPAGHPAAEARPVIVPSHRTA